MPLLVLALIMLALVTAAVVEGQPNPVKIRTNRSVYNVGDPVVVEVKVDLIGGGPYPASLTFNTPAGTFTRSLGAIPGSVWNAVTVTGVTAVAGPCTVSAEVLVGSVLWVAQTSFTVAGGPGPGFDFTIVLTPSSNTVEQGGIAMYRILLTYSSPAWSGTTINIQVAGLGPGMTWSATTAGDLTIVTSRSTPTGTYTIVVIGSARGVTHQTSALLTVIQRAPPFDFSVSISPLVQTVRIGDKTTYSVTVNLVSGSASPVTLSLSGLPSGVVYSFSPQSGTPAFGSTLTVDATAAQSTGSYSVTVSASGGGVTKTATGTLMIEEAARFLLTVVPTTASVKQGDKAVFTIAVTPTGVFNQPVSLLVRGLPAGVSSSFSIPSGNPPFTSLLTLEISSAAQEGAYPLTIEASGAGKTDSSTVTLNIEKSPKQKSTITVSATSQDGKIAVSGSLAPPVEGADVTLTYRGPDGSTITRDAFVESDGTFRDLFSPPIEGEWTVTASWPGNAKYEASPSESTSLTVEKGGFQISDLLSNTTNLLLIAVAVLVLVAIGVMLGRRRASAPAVPQFAASYCPSCGAVLDASEDYCRSCGARVR